MKTITKISGIMILGSLMLTAQPGFAQQTADKQEQQSYHIKIVKDENGKQEVIDKTFSSQQEMDAYMKENKMDAPPLNDLPPLPTVMSDKKEKRIMIGENEEGNGHTSLSITYENFSPEERAELIQNVLNQKSGKVKVEMIKEKKMEWVRTDGAMQAPEPPKAPGAPMAPKAPAEAWVNLTDVKVFPNPATGQFHLSFGVGRAADVVLRVTDLTGKEVYIETFKNYSGKFEKEISSGNLTTGTYIVDVQAGSEKNTVKVVMQ